MRHVLLSTLAVGLLAVAASPASAGTIKLTSPADAGPVKVTFDEVSIQVPTEFGTEYTASDGVTFTGLFADRDEGPAQSVPSSGSYQGFAQYMGGGTVASNFDLTFDYSTPRYGQLAAVQHVNSSLTIAFASAVDQVGFDFISQPTGAFTVELLSGGTAISGSAFTFATQLDTSGAPIVGFAGLRNLGGFDGVKITLLQNQYFAMNDLRFGVAVVPLPPAAFTGLGLLAALGIAYRLRRRRQLI